MSLTIINPQAKTIDRTPQIQWTYPDYQSGYVIFVRNSSNTQIAYEDIRSGSIASNQYYDFTTPLSYDIYMAYVVVVNPDSSFSGGSPTGAKYITSISRTTSNALVTVTTSTSHGLTSGQSILITGAGAAFDGFFDIKPGSVTSNSFGYTYSHGPKQT